MTDPLKNLKGIIGVVNTPFTDDNKIDCDSLRRYVEHSIKCGVVGFLVLGMAAEVNKLSIDEKFLIAKTIVDQVVNRIPVIAGTSSQTQKERIFLAKELSKIGCDGILINIPFEEEKSFGQNVKEVSENISGFMMLQDWDFHGFGIPVNVINRLFNELENFECLKIEVVPAGVKYSEVRKISGGKLHLSGGWAGTQMIEALDRGVDAFMPTILHDVYNKIFQLHRMGKREKAKSVFEKLLPIISFSHQHLDISIYFNKKLVNKQGIFSTAKVREPILPFDEYHERLADELIVQALELSRDIAN